MPFLHKPKKRQPWFLWAEEKSRKTGHKHKIFYPEGGYYKGDWLRCYQYGKGAQYLPSGKQYEGDWLCNKRDGFGVESQYNKEGKIFDLVYLGDFKNDKRHGYGCLHLDDGSFYEGEFKLGKRHGFGRCWFNDGSYYEGYWVKNVQHGFGMFVKANGNRFEGQWRNGKKDGWGIVYHLNTGQKQKGLWENEICITSTMEDTPVRQSALFPTKYPIPPLELDPSAPCCEFLQKADSRILQYNEGCQLHKYCYKMTPQKSRKDFTQDTD